MTGADVFGALVGGIAAGLALGSALFSYVAEVKAREAYLDGYRAAFEEGRACPTPRLCASLRRASEARRPAALRLVDPVDDGSRS